MLRPGPLAALCAAGIVASSWALAPLWAGALALAVLALRRRSDALALVGVALTIVAVAGAYAQWREPQRDETVVRAQTEVTGLVTRPAVERADGSWRLRVAVGERLLDVRSARPAQAGDVVRLVGRVRPLRGARNFGGADRAAAARAEGLDAELLAESLVVIGREGGPWLGAWRAMGAVRARWSAAMVERAPRAEPRAVLRGVTLGVRTGVSEALGARWRAVGVYHVLSVSGLHLAVVALVAFAALRRIAAVASLWANPARVAFAPAAALAIGYTMLTGAEVATLRALVVALLWMAAAALGRPLRLVDALGSAALLLLAWQPAQLGQPSFQLSFAAALALALRAPGQWSNDARGWRRLARALARWLVEGMTTSAWVAVITAPITAWWFQESRRPV